MFYGADNGGACALRAGNHQIILQRMATVGRNWTWRPQIMRYLHADIAV